MNWISGKLYEEYCGYFNVHCNTSVGFIAQIGEWDATNFIRNALIMEETRLQIQSNRPPHEKKNCTLLVLTTRFRSTKRRIIFNSEISSVRDN